MALLAYMPNAACAVPGGAGQLPEAPSESESAEGTTGGTTPFDRAGMRIWYVDRSEGGNVSRIVDRYTRAPRARLGEDCPLWRPLSASLPAHAYEIHPGPAP